MPAGLTPGPAHQEPFSLGIHTQPSFDVIDALPERAAERLRALRQQFYDRHALTVPFADIQEASTARIQAEQRLKLLLDHPHDGGHHLREDDPRVIEQQRLLAKLTDDLRRLNERNEVRTAEWQTASASLSAVESSLRDGRPPGVVLEDYEVDVPKPLKGENGLLDQIENRRRRVRELRADLNRITSSPFPSSHCKGRMREMVEQLAQQGAPSVSRLVEHDLQIEWPTQRVQSAVHNVGPGAVGFAELEAAIPLLVWLHKDALVKKLDAEIDAEADDKAALSSTEREKRTAEVQGDLLAVERQEASLVWRAMEENLPVFHRADCSPLAILQVRLTAPRTNGSPSEGLGWNILGGRRR